MKTNVENSNLFLASQELAESWINCNQIGTLIKSGLDFAKLSPTNSKVIQVYINILKPEKKIWFVMRDPTKKKGKDSILFQEYSNFKENRMSFDPVIIFLIPDGHKYLLASKKEKLNIERSYCYSKSKIKGQLKSHKRMNAIEA